VNDYFYKILILIKSKILDVFSSKKGIDALKNYAYLIYIYIYIALLYCNKQCIYFSYSKKLNIAK